MNHEVTSFLDGLGHPHRAGIEMLRNIILEAAPGLGENIKWNGPNYSMGNEDLLTLKINPPKNIQLIFHRGAKKKEEPKKMLIPDPTGLLAWKTNDRAVATFPNAEKIRAAQAAVTVLVKDWVSVNR